ncbi:MAG TPA: RAMP superfamily CRISPR-associated protein [Candidatus Marinimicrobia bacterium]|nr:RAMP superfamily CRISPR-associated protein [Candidatus Neomarinimicrobiota bacterium]
MKVKNVEIVEKNEGTVKILQIPLTVRVRDGSFLHIGASLSPLTEKKGAIFKVDKKPVIPASSFKGALRNQLEELFINKSDTFMKEFNIRDAELIKPCLPATNPTKFEKELLSHGTYRNEYCSIQVDGDNIKLSKSGICPVCYLMGCTGIMGFLRIPNFFPEGKAEYIDQTRIRIDRKMNTAAKGAKVDGEQVVPGTIFKGKLETVLQNPNLSLDFGMSRKVDNDYFDKWLISWSETELKKRQEYIINNIIVPALESIHLLGGWKSVGAGMVNVDIG